MKRLALLLLCVLSVPALAQEQVLQISGANFRPVSMAVPAPVAEAGVAKPARDFDQALLFDLAALGTFQLLERKGFLADPNEGLDAAGIKFARWADVGAEALVKTRLTVAGEELRADLVLYNVGSAKEELRITERGPVTAPRRLAHRLADALYKHYTREPGPFASGRLAFVKQAGKMRSVWISDWDGSHAQAVATSGLDMLPDLSVNGTVAYTSYRSGTPALWAQVPGGEAKRLDQGGRMATGVAFSPDGARIAYSLAEGEGAQIFVASADGSGAQKVTDTAAFINSSPTWSPDGKRLAFVSNRFGTPQIFVMNADGSGVQRLTYQGKYNQTPVWSPRGDLIAFTARDEKNAFDIFTVEVASRKVTRLTQGQGNNEEPTFAPNGRLVMFSSTRNGGTRLFVSTLDGSKQLALPMAEGRYLTPAWSRVRAD